MKDLIERVLNHSKHCANPDGDHALFSWIVDIVIESGLDAGNNSLIRWARGGD